MIKIFCLLGAYEVTKCYRFYHTLLKGSFYSMRRNSIKTRSIYEEYWETNIPSGYDVHHIDLNPLNDDPNNLLALPKSLHSKYHTILSKIKSICTPFSLEINMFSENEMYMKLYEEINAVLKECADYIQYRNDYQNLPKYE